MFQRFSGAAVLSITLGGAAMAQPDALRVPVDTRDSIDQVQTIETFILAGQSNAVGFGSNAHELPPPLFVPQEDILFWFEEGPWNSIDNPALRIDSGGSLIALQYQTDPTGATFGGYVDGFGPEISMGRAIADDSGSFICIVKFAINATSLAEDWTPGDPGPLYDEMLALVDAAEAALRDLGWHSDIAGFFWMQGEWDARSAAFANSYEANLTNLIVQVRADLGDDDLPFVFGRLNENIHMSPYGITLLNLATVRAAQESVAAAVPGAVLVDTDDLPLTGDWIHFSADAQVSLGERFAESLLLMKVRVDDASRGAEAACSELQRSPDTGP